MTSAYSSGHVDVAVVLTDAASPGSLFAGEVMKPTMSTTDRELGLEFCVVVFHQFTLNLHDHVKYAFYCGGEPLAVTVLPPKEDDMFHYCTLLSDMAHCASGPSV